MKRNGFTLAEVLITLGIIGIVAAMTIPTLITNIQKKTTETRLKSTYAILLNAIRLSEAENGTLEGWDIKTNDYDNNTTMTRLNSVDAYLNNYFLPYIKGFQVCKTNQSTCNVKSPKSLSGQDSSYYFSFDTSRSTSILLQNGVLLNFGAYAYDQFRFQIEIRIDLNGGNNGPNVLGKDLFWLILAPNGYLNNPKPGLYFYNQGQNKNYLLNKQYACSKTVGESLSGLSCGALLLMDNFKINNYYPW